MKTALPLPGTTTLVFAHRGAMAYRPQNTLPSFEFAWELGVDGIELDVQCTSDGVPVVFHDDTLDSLTDGTGNIRSKTLEEILALDAGSHFSAQYAGERIPLLETVLRARPAGSFVNIEIKTALRTDSIPRQLLRPLTGFSPLKRNMDTVRENEACRVARITADCIRSLAAKVPELPAHIIISSFDPIALEAFGREMPELPLGYLHSSSSHYDTKPLMEEIIYQAWHPYWREVRAGAVLREHKAGRRVNCWTVNSAGAARWLAGMKVDGVISNKPDEMLAALNR
jgi:glycerophosphoryl diester phosphodiesterase